MVDKALTCIVPDVLVGFYPQTKTTFSTSDTLATDSLCNRLKYIVTNELNGNLLHVKNSGYDNSQEYI